MELNMSNKTLIQECIERSSRLDFMHWFHANKERLLNQEKEQLISFRYAQIQEVDAEEIYNQIYDSQS